MKHVKFKELLDSKKFNITVTIVNAVLIVGLVGYLLFLHFSASATGSAQQIADVDVQEVLKEADASMPGVYTALIAGSDFDLGKGMEFHFGMDGTYAGYFDADNTSVKDYTYEVSAGEESYKLTIYSADKAKYVEYQMSFDKDGHVVLTYPGMDKSLVLEY